MDFTLSAEQDLLKKELRHFLDTECPKSTVKKLEATEGDVAEAQVEKLLASKEEIVKAGLPVEQNVLRALAQKIQAAGRACILVGKDNLVVCVGDKKHSARELLKNLTDKNGGSGGGDEKLAMGKLGKKPF